MGNEKEQNFHALADAMLEELFDVLEARDSEGEFEIELEEGSLSISFDSGKQYLVNKHAPSAQLWVASPISGGLHFSYTASGWCDNQGKQLKPLVLAEINQLSGKAAA